MTRILVTGGSGFYGRAMLQIGGIVVLFACVFGGYLMKIYAWKTLLGEDGVINSALHGLGLIDQPISALLYSPFAVILTRPPSVRRLMPCFTAFSTSVSTSIRGTRCLRATASTSTSTDSRSSNRTRSMARGTPTGPRSSSSSTRPKAL